MSDAVLALTNTDPRFYPTLGPFLSRREVVRHVGDTIWDDDAKTWLVALDADTVTGFIAVAARGRLSVESLYTVPGHENTAPELVNAAVARFGERALHAVVRHEHAPPYQQAGFRPVGKTRNFTKLTRDAPS